MPECIVAQLTNRFSNIVTLVNRTLRTVLHITLRIRLSLLSHSIQAPLQHSYTIRPLKPYRYRADTPLEWSNPGMNLPRYLPATFLALCTLSSMLYTTADAAPASLEKLGWKERSFSGNSEYSLVDHHGMQAIRGRTDSSASALYKDLGTDLRKTPYLSWQWQVENVFDNPHERAKKGDDFPARVYVVYKKGPFPWNTLAINYVWSSDNSIGDHWGSAYTKKSHVVVLQSGDAKAGQWVAEKRNVAEDFKTFFGIDVRKINGYAIMVDGDNTSSTATTWFADIDFSNR